MMHFQSVRNSQNEKGFILITAYLMLSVASVLSFALFNHGHVFIQSVERNQNRMIAFNLGEAGLDIALSQLASNKSYAGTAYTSLNSSYSKGGYAITVTTPTDNPDVRIITATGYAPDNVSSSKNYETRSVTTYTKYINQKYFEYGVFAKNSIDITSNATIDSYNSTNGAYGGSNVGSNADVGTDSITAGSFSTNGTIKGDAVVGPTGDPNTVIDGSGTISGTKTAATSAKDFNPATTSIASSGSINLSNGTLTLAAGTYRYDSIKLSGQGEIIVTGPVTIYVDGSIDITGQGITNQSQKPPDCLIYGTGSSDIKLAGKGTFFGAIYAPNSAIKNTGNAEVYGALVSKEYQQSGNGAVHYDEALKDIGGSGSGVSILAWKESNTSSWGTGS